MIYETCNLDNLFICILVSIYPRQINTAFAIPNTILLGITDASFKLPAVTRYWI